MIYTKEFLIDAFIWRYTDILLNDTCLELDKYVQMVRDHYDVVGKERFRIYASLDADEIQKFRLATGY